MKPYIVSFDTEDDSHGNPTLFAFVHSRGSFWCRTRADFLSSILALRDRMGKRRKLHLWATNLEYDLVNLFGPEGISQVTLRFGRSHLVSARWEGIEFRDTLRHVPASVEELGGLVGLPKLEEGLFKPGETVTEEKLIRRCVRDATITYRFAKKLSEIYASLHVEPKTTLASTAYNLWESRFYGKRLEAAPGEIVKCAKEAYHGGRTEPFKIGECRDVIVCDVSSMFPWAMLQNSFPLPSSPVRLSRTIQALGVYRIRAESDLSIPLLPYRGRAGTDYPNGNFSGWYVGEELQRFVAMGGRCKIIEGYEFLEGVKPFDRYVKTLFRRKAVARGALRLVYKLLLNSLYGKFGQGGSRVIITPLMRWEANGQPHEWDSHIWNGLVIYRSEAPPPPWGNNIWAAIITARARVRLHQEMMRIRALGATVLYCDTDSIMYSGIDPIHPAKADAPGQFETRGIYRRMIIEGKKEYGLEIGPGKWEFHVKGVPYSERASYLFRGYARFSRPNRLLEASRRGITPNVWETRNKKRHVNFRDRARTRDGLLTPLIVNER
jgi:hypothetical protein